MAMIDLSPGCPEHIRCETKAIDTQIAGRYAIDSRSKSAMLHERGGDFLLSNSCIIVILVYMVYFLCSTSQLACGYHIPLTR